MASAPWLLLLMLPLLGVGRLPAEADPSFEAAFQGECREDSPCQHLCFDLHDGTFECACKDGYTLDDNGYGCIENSQLEMMKQFKRFNADNATETPWNTAVESVTHIDGVKTFRLKSLNRMETDDDDDDDENDEEQVNFESSYTDGGINLDATYRIVQPDTDSSRKKPTQVPSLKPQVPMIRSQAEFLSTTPLESDVYQPMNTVTVTTPPSHPPKHSCQNVFCHEGGVCVSDARTASARCRCPLGRTGPMCEKISEIRYPRFVGTSYLVLPVLRDAHKSMQVILEFRPETYDGILLYSGENADLQGDFIAIVLNKGFVEFRFDCGMGEGVLRSHQPVILHSWNTLSIYRDRWDAWMQLNSGKQIQGRSKGLFSRITFRQNLFLGGPSDENLVFNRLQSTTAFTGCVRKLEINNRIYDFRSGNKGDAVQGADIEECNADVCSRMVCRNGGQCVATSPDSGTCMCPLGFAGAQCDAAVDIIVPSFNGSSYLQFPGLANSVLSFVEIRLAFKPKEPNGVLLYNGYKMDGTGDFISINMVNGFVEFRFDLGTGPAIIRSISPVTMDEWHSVFISRTGRDGILEVDGQPTVEGISPGAFTQLSLPLNLYIGGISELRDTARRAGIMSSLNGCIQKVEINSRPLKLIDDALSGVNVANCQHPCVDRPCYANGICEPRKEFYSCHCPIGYAGPYCEKEVNEMIAEPMMTGSSYLHYVDEDIMRRIRGSRVDIRLKLKTFAANGLILWAGERDMTSSSDYLALGIADGYLQFQYNLGSGEVVISYNVSRVDDGRWHLITAIRVEQDASLIIDGGPVVIGMSPGPLNQLNVNNGLYIGGMKDIVHLSLNKYQSGLVGCLANVTLSTDYHVRLVTHAATGVNIQPCA